MKKSADSLILISDLCDLYERRFSGSEEIVPEMIRVIDAVANGHVAILADGAPLSSALRSDMADRDLLWVHVVVEPIPEIH